MTVHALRMELGDTDVNFPLMSDVEYRYFLDKNDWSIRRASLDAAKSMVMKLSLRPDETFDIFSIKGSGAAKQYMAALQLYIANPNLNPIYNNAMPYAGGISKLDMETNDANFDNNITDFPIREVEYPSINFKLEV